MFCHLKRTCARTCLCSAGAGVFLVGIICSGSYTNTQIHVEDLLLMSININIFGASYSCQHACLLMGNDGMADGPEM